MSRDYRINVVHVISHEEQVAWVLTPAGGFLVASIPDARHDTAQDAGILAKVDTPEEAEQLFRRLYGRQD